MSEDLRQSLATELANDLARAIEAMTSEQPQLRVANDAPPAGSQVTTWRQKFTATSGAAWLTASEAAWTSIGERTLRAAGIDDGDAETSKSTFVETLGQAFSMLASSLSGRTKTEWACTEGGEYQELPASVRWTSIHLGFADGVSESLFVAFDPEVIQDLVKPREASVSKIPNAAAAVTTTVRTPVASSKTLELLLDVELPVCVSFGRAQLPLKDLIKLTTGSIVELNRTLSEPVEVIVNNCVIARGEVVVVEGNYGVRIQQVVSREERLRTLY
jgi:flagellar motor switch protein FliN/FliY